MKLSVSLPEDEFEYLDKCVEDGLYPSRSAVVLRALKLLRGRELGSMYAEAADEWLASAEGADWDAVDTASDVS